MGPNLGLMERLRRGPVICAEGYLFELERRGFVSAGAFVPEVVLTHPEAVRALHREFVHAGSDVVQAFTYYAHREKLRLIGKEAALEEMNRSAVRIAKEVAGESGALVAGDICNTNVFVAEDPSTHGAARAMFEEQSAWAAEEGVDFIVAETFSDLAEARLALEAMRETGLPTVVTMAIHRQPVTRDGFTPADCCKALEDAGADVVGLNCARGPATMLPLLKPILDAVSCPVAALPVPYRTHPEEPTFQSLTDRDCHVIPDSRPFPVALDPFTCNRFEIAAFTLEARSLGVDYFGVCCGAGAHHIRSMAEALGRNPPASAYSPDMSKHAFFGTDSQVPDAFKGFAKDL